MAQNGIYDPTFKQIICDSAQNNVNAVGIVYGTNDPSIPMVDSETVEESLSIPTGRCELAIATHAR